MPAAARGPFRGPRSDRPRCAPCPGSCTKSSDRPASRLTQAFVCSWNRGSAWTSATSASMPTRAQAASAQAVNALAYTVGRDVVFGTGQYEPSSPGSRRLLAHELAHVSQQTRRAHESGRRDFSGPEVSERGRRESASPGEPARRWTVSSFSSADARLSRFEPSPGFQPPPVIPVPEAEPSPGMTPAPGTSVAPGSPGGGRCRHPDRPSDTRARRATFPFKNSGIGPTRPRTMNRREMNWKRPWPRPIAGARDPTL